VAVAVGGFVGGLTAELLGAPRVVSAGVYAVGVAVGGWGPGRDGLSALRSRRLDVDLLMVVAAVAAALLGQWRDASLLIVIFAGSGALEEGAAARTAAGARALLVSAPDVAERFDDDGEIITVPTEALDRGDRVLVRQGARVPADDVVADGEAAVDEASLTGEPLPVRKLAGRPVLAGSTVTEGVLVVDVTAAPGDSVLARLSAAVAEAVEQFEQRGRWRWWPARSCWHRRARGGSAGRPTRPRCG